MRIFLVTLFLLSGVLAMAEKSSVDNYTVINNNKNIAYAVVSSEGNSYRLANGKTLNSSGNILVSFIEVPDTASFESKFNVMLLKKGHVWDVFKNNSSLNDLELAAKITADMNGSVKTAIPDWVMNVSPR